MAKGGTVDVKFMYDALIAVVAFRAYEADVALKAYDALIVLDEF